MSQSHFIVLLLSVIVLWMATTVQSQDCPLPTRSLVEDLLEADIKAGGGDPGSDFVLRGGPFYTCQAQGTSNGTYRWLSAIVEYTSNLQDRVGQFEMRCITTSNIIDWTHVQDSLTILSQSPGITYDGSVGLRTNCSECNGDTGDPDDHCVACNPACNSGLMRCTGSGNTECCISFEDDGTCSTDTECDDTNFVANQQKDFFCSCNLTSCDPGYSVTTNSSGCYCVLSNICMTQPSPCNNNGSCTLNSPPDNFTCNCTDTGYTGDTCNDIVPTTTTVSTTTTTTTTSSSAVAIITTSSYTIVTTQITTAETVATFIAVPTTSLSVSVTPSAGPTEEIIIDDETALWVIIVTVIIALLLLILLIILIIYIIYYFLTKNGSNIAKTKPSSPFGNGESHNNPLYLKPDEVTSEVANLYTP